jgi:hypothetical protein
MSYDRYRYVALCEDEAHYRFILHFLKNKGVNTDRKLTLFTNYPQGRGDAKDHIKNFLPKVKSEYPRAQSRGQTIYIIARDADKEDYCSVCRELDCGGFENIFLVIPKRNIETWLYFLTTNAPDSGDEETDRKNHAKYNIRDCAKKLSDMTDVPDIAPLSFKNTVLRLKELTSR